MIRECKQCGGRVRTASWAPDRPTRCRYCKVELPVEPAGPWNGRTRRGRSGTAWNLGLLTEVLGVALPVAFLVAHDRFSMNWLGGSVVALVLAFLVVTTGRVSRIGSPHESIVLNNVVLVLLWLLVLYGSLAFAPLDGLGESAMLVISVSCIVMAGVFESERGLGDKAREFRLGGAALLLLFMVAYAYHAARPWIGR